MLWIWYEIFVEEINLTMEHFEHFDLVTDYGICLGHLPTCFNCKENNKGYVYVVVKN